MLQHSHLYTTQESLSGWLDTFTPTGRHSDLIQLFSGIFDTQLLQGILGTISAKLPKAVVIGTTTSGEIMNGEMHDESIVIALSRFEETALKSIHIRGGDDEEMGRGIARGIVDEDTKCIIMFADGILCNGDAILRGLNSACPKEIVVSGGMAGDNENFAKSYCIHGSELFEQGVVAVALSNPGLQVFHTYNLSWKPIGKEMIVTRSKGNILYEVDHQPIKEIYARYLGEDVVQQMPASTIEFPLISHAGGVDIARSMIALNKDEGIVYAGELPQGTKVRFGVGSPNMLTRSAYSSYSKAREKPIEALFVYSCIARKAFLGKTLESEFAPLEEIAPLNGFFTYGEFYHGSEGNKLLNVTSTVLGLSESARIKKKPGRAEAKFNYGSHTIGALMNLVEVTMQENEAFALELKETNRLLKLKESALNASANGIVITDIDGNIEWANEAYSTLTGYAPHESLGINPRELVNSNVHEKAFFKALWETILSNRVWHGEVVNRRKDGSLYDEEMTITPMSDEEGNIRHFVAVKQDITERKKMERLVHQFAFYDTLTKLPNRRLLADRLSQVQAVAKRSGRYGAILFLDLDNFKPLNDTYGHTVGDMLLVEVASRIKVCVRDSDTVARFGGDEFVILLSELSSDKEEATKYATSVAEKIRATLAQAYFLTVPGNGYETSVVEHHCTSSIGVTLFLNYEASQDEILKWADAAMYRAKESGRNRMVLHTP